MEPFEIKCYEAKSNTYYSLIIGSFLYIDATGILICGGVRKEFAVGEYERLSKKFNKE